MCNKDAREGRAFRAHVLTIAALNHIIKMVTYPSRKGQYVVGSEHKDDDFEYASQEVD